MVGKLIPSPGRQPGGIWRNPGFLKLWIGQSVSLVGSRVTMLALPLTAILTLHASPLEVAILGAAAPAASLLASLPAGLWADRARRRPILIAASIAQALLLLTVPVAAALGILRLPQLCIVAFLTASLAVLFRVVHRAFLPALIEGEQLVTANSTLSATASVAQLTAPGLGGFLVQFLSAPVAIIADAVSFLVSAAMLAAIRIDEGMPPKRAATSIRADIGDGLRALAASPLLRSLTGAAAIFEFFDSVLFAVYFLYLSRGLHLGAASIGLIFGLAGAGGLLGALAAAPLGKRLGLGPAMITGLLLAVAGEVAIAGVGGPAEFVVLLLLLAEGTVELGASLYAVNAGSLQQAITADFLRGRMAATADLLTSAAAPAGFVLGGLLGEYIGLRGTVLVAGLGTLLSLGWLVRSPVRRLRRLPSGPFSPEPQSG